MVYYSMLVSALSQGLLYAPMALGVFITFRILHPRKEGGKALIDGGAGLLYWGTSGVHRVCCASSSGTPT